MIQLDAVAVAVAVPVAVLTGYTDGDTKPNTQLLLHIVDEARIATRRLALFMLMFVFVFVFVFVFLLMLMLMSISMFDGIMKS